MRDAYKVLLNAVILKLETYNTEKFKFNQFRFIFTLVVLTLIQLAVQSLKPYRRLHQNFPPNPQSLAWILVTFNPPLDEITFNLPIAKTLIIPKVVI